jgi:hypothetical protein
MCGDVCRSACVVRAFPNFFFRRARGTPLPTPSPLEKLFSPRLAAFINWFPARTLLKKSPPRKIPGKSQESADTKFPTSFFFSHPWYHSAHDVRQ